MGGEMRHIARKIAGVVLAVAGMTGLAAEALTVDVISFRSPTGNISCILGKMGHETFATCEILESTPTYTRKPADCDLDWGSSFSVGVTGRGELNCHGDTIRSEDALVLPYGKVLELYGISCRSEKTGMTCENIEGGGFTIGRARQRVF